MLLSAISELDVLRQYLKTSGKLGSRIFNLKTFVDVKIVYFCGVVK